MKLLSANAFRQWEEASAKAQGVTLYDLMERAGRAVAAWLMEAVPEDVPLVVVCGPRSNGGDGLVAARLLYEGGRSVQALLLKFKTEPSADNVHALGAARAVDPGLVLELEEGQYITGIPAAAVVVDALLGTGARPLEGWLAEVVSRLNSLPNPVVSIDLPSGLSADAAPPTDAVVMCAQHTLVIGGYKRTLLHPEGGRYAGTVHVLYIGLDAELLGNVPTHFNVLTAADAATCYRPRDPFSHKDTHGTAFLIGGSKGLVGALALAVQAAGRAGAGKVRGLVPECGYTILQTIAPEAMCRTSGTDAVVDFSGWEEARGIGIGPGLGTAPQTADALTHFLKTCPVPVVLDADALNLISDRPALLSDVSPGSILTPHPGEAARLMGQASSSLVRVDAARALAMRHNVVVVAKDKHTAICTPGGEVWYNLAGNAGLATGGSGDVLCGLLTGLLASGYAPVPAAMLGVYLHAAAGDLAAAEISQEALLAGDLLDHIGPAFRTLGPL